MKISLSKVTLLAVIAALLSACLSNSIIVIDSANQNSRIDYIVIHGTSENFSESLRLLTTRTDNPVSAHYLIPEAGDPSYGDRALRIHSLVPEHGRAWHAGVSRWGRETSLNDRSIGIELVNQFKCSVSDRQIIEIEPEGMQCEFTAYSDQQISLLISLLKELLLRYPEIDPIDVVGHSDIAVMRKSDPGPLFPWQRLYAEGIGAWPDEDVVARYRHYYEEALPTARQVQQALNLLGYEVEISGELDRQTRFALRAFQLHYRPASYSGLIDTETASLLWALLEKYRSDDAGELTVEIVRR